MTRKKLHLKASILYLIVISTLKCRFKKTKQLLIFWLTLPNRLTLKLTPQAFGDGSVMREVTLSR